MKTWLKALSLHGLIGEFVAHVVFPLKTGWDCGPLDWWCQTGFPFAFHNPWIFYHVSVHAALGMGVVYLLLPQRFRKWLGGV